jgi:hypothetical protein
LRSEKKYSRREMLLATGALVLPSTFQQDSAQTVGRPAGRLQDPRMAGRPRERITDYENDPFIIGIESRLACTCGCTLDVYTCRTTDFTCGTSPAMHREVVRLIQQGKTEEEVVGAFVAQYGETVLMAPPKSGFNLVGYVLPGLGIFGVGAAMLWMLVGRSRLGGELASVGPEAGAGGSEPEISDEDAALLEKELGDLDL